MFDNEPRPGANLSEWPCPPALDQAGKACQDKHSSLKRTLVSNRRKKFYNVGLKTALPGLATKLKKKMDGSENTKRGEVSLYC